MQLRPENASTVTYACCVLHNMLSVMRPKHYLSTVAQQANAEGADIEWRDLRNLAKLQARRGQRNRQEAVEIRDYLRSYYNGIGAVPWQENAVMSHVGVLVLNNVNLILNLL